MTTPISGLTSVADVQRSNIVDQVTSRLRDAILDGTIQPGSRLIQEQVAASFGVSRTPVREAFKVLVNEGLLEKTRSSNAADVVSLQGDSAREYYEIRGAIDGLAASLAARQRTPAAIKKLSGLSREIDRSIDPFDTGKFLKAHTAFHLAILEASGNSRMRQFEIIVRISSQMLYPQLKTDQERMRTSAAEHSAIVTAIVAGDSDGAERIARDHIKSAAQRWLKEVES